MLYSTFFSFCSTCTLLQSIELITFLFLWIMIFWENVAILLPLQTIRWKLMTLQWRSVCHPWWRKLFHYFGCFLRNDLSLLIMLLFVTLVSDLSKKQYQSLQVSFGIVYFLRTNCILYFYQGFFLRKIYLKLHSVAYNVAIPLNKLLR